MIRNSQACQGALRGMAILVQCFILGQFAAIQLNFRSSTSTFVSTTNLQHFPLNGGGTI
jgi:hypothetical protein